MNPNDGQRTLDAILRRDLGSFTEKCFHQVSPGQRLSRAPYLQAISWHLQQCLNGTMRRLIISLPPRHLKSISASVAFPAFVFGHDPTARIICASYSGELSGKLARDGRAVMNSDWYRRLFPGTRLSTERSAEHDFMTTQRGFRVSTSVGGTLTGRGGNWVILDDPQKPDEAMSELRRASVSDWFDNTLISRLDNKSTDVIILIMQRLHPDDLVGHILGKDEGWVHLNLPAIAEIGGAIPIGPNTIWHRKVGDLLDPSRETMDTLQAIKLSMGSSNFAAQYQQQPVPPEGELIKWAWFKSYDVVPRSGRIIQSWDTASKAGELNDYSVCTTWMIVAFEYYLLDIFRKKLQYPDLRRAVIEQQQRWQASTILIEDKASGMALAQDFRGGELRQAGYPIRIEPEADKITRAAAQSSTIEAGRVHLPRLADWLADLRLEILQFPYGRHDDQVDSMTQFLKWANKPPMQAYKVRLGGV